MLEEAKETAAQDDLIITNNVLVTLANISIIVAGDCPDKTKVFNERPSDKQMCSNWKPTYREV